MLEKVKEILVESLNIEGSEVVPSARLNEDLGIDSLSSIELALELESACKDWRWTTCKITNCSRCNRYNRVKN